MILENQYWYDIVPKDFRHSLGTVAGKWLYFNETKKCHSFLKDLDELVEAGEIKSVKIARKLPDFDPFPQKPCVICIFTSDDPKEKHHVQKLLKNRFNIEVKVWKSEVQTYEDWEEGGWLWIQSEITRIRRNIASGKIEDIESEQNRLIELTEMLEKTLQKVDDPNRKAEIELNIIHELGNSIKTSLSGRTIDAKAIIKRMSKLEATVEEIRAKTESGEIYYKSHLQEVERDYVFIIMPFASKHIDTYDAIRRAARIADTNLNAQRVDEKPGAISITDEILKCIEKANLIICDLTEERPNVYYELGYAKGLKKPTICIARKGTTLHFDVYGFKTIFFETYRELETNLSDEISKMLEFLRAIPTDKRINTDAADLG